MMPSIQCFRCSLVAAALAFAPITFSLHAQMSERVQVVNVPFAFQEGTQVFSAGVYTVTQSANNIVRIQGHDSGGQAMSLVQDSGRKAPMQGKVVFARYGDTYFLREIWQAGESAHAVCIKTGAESKAEKAAHTNFASAKTAAAVEVSILSPTR